MIKVTELLVSTKKTAEAMFSQFDEHAIMEKHVHVIEFVSAYKGPLAVDKLWNADVDRLYPLSRLESFLVGEVDRLMQGIRSVFLVSNGYQAGCF